MWVKHHGDGEGGEYTIWSEWPEAWQKNLMKKTGVRLWPEFYYDGKENATESKKLFTFQVYNVSKEGRNDL